MARSDRPQDPPATEFEADPVVSDLISDNRPQYFGLVVVTGWPPTPKMVSSYRTFIENIRQCFDDDDLIGDYPSVYLYDSAHLHVTVASLHPVRVRSIGAEPSTHYEALEKSWRHLVESASRRPEWPTSPLEFEIDSCQIGRKAGIMLWKESTGGLAKIRSCLASEASEKNHSTESPLKIHSIPGIIHSTFLRFNRIPSSNGELVQSRLQSKVLPALHDTFSGRVIYSDVKLVCERIPYMHIPNDKRHVIASFPLC